MTMPFFINERNNVHYHKKKTAKQFYRLAVIVSLATVTFFYSQKRQSI